MASQKVVIPKGLVNPNETTIVEIPKTLQNVRTVIARPRRSSSASPTRTPPPGPTTYRPAMERNKTFPKRKIGGQFGMLHEGGTTFGGMQDWGDSTVSEDTPSSIVPETRLRTSYVLPRNNQDISQADVSYSEFRMHPQFESTLRWYGEDDVSLFRDSHPSAKSSPVRFHPKNIPQSTPGQSYRKSTVTSSSPSGLYESSEEMMSHPGASSYDTNEWTSSFASAQPVRYPTGGDDSNPSSSFSQRDVLNSLGSIESSEASQIMSDLTSFQSARRQLILDASSLSSPGDVSSGLMMNWTV